MAVRRTVLVTWAAAAGVAERDDVVSALVRAGAGPGVSESWVRPTLPGTVRGGDLVWHLAFADEEALGSWAGSDPARRADRALTGRGVGATTGATYDEGRTATREVPGERPVHRTLLLQVDGDAATVRRFEEGLVAMGEEIPVMRLWRLSRVRAGVGRAEDGPCWTHVWEQIFADPSGLAGPYLRHPYHWGEVDRWFDGESPDAVVAPTFCHTFCLLG